MKTPPLLIVADRGVIKTFMANGQQAGSVPQLADTIRIDEAHQKYQDIYTDQAGSFAKRGTGHVGNSTAERMHVDTEKETRIIRLIGEHVTELLDLHRPKKWGFAAPSDINGAILSHLSQAWTNAIEVNLTKDLTKESPAHLRDHFLAARGAA
ncbi:host attachment protein [Verrucomicrobium spinosum]|uniref:host attachment protein n=1 Tax=Verrucomicrobium spinosum TaxID=2736 RepID=UPI0001746399|nr:host attachment protein [Verrucomicrobium spinosum]